MPTCAVLAMGTVQTGLLLLFFWRLLLLFLPIRAEHSERTEALWMLALSKSDPSRCSSSLCGGSGGRGGGGRAVSPEPALGAHLQASQAWGGGGTVEAPEAQCCLSLVHLVPPPS